MIQKLIYAVLLLCVSTTTSWELNKGYPVDNNDEPEQEDPGPICDQVFCGLPCPRASMPRPRCPENATRCRSGCACITYCDEENVHYCFDTTPCLYKKRSFLHGKNFRRATTKPTDDPLSTASVENIDETTEADNDTLENPTKWRSPILKS